MDHRGETNVGLFVSCANASKRLELAEEVFDEMAPPIFLPIVRGMPARSLAQRDDGFYLGPLIPDKGQAIDASNESVKTRDVVAMAWQQHEADQIAESIDERRDLRRPAAARLANGLFLSHPFAPVPC